MVELAKQQSKIATNSPRDSCRFLIFRHMIGHRVYHSIENHGLRPKQRNEIDPKVAVKLQQSQVGC